MLFEPHPLVDKIKQLVKEDPDISFEKFKEANPEIVVSNYTYYKYRKEIRKELQLSEIGDLNQQINPDVIQEKSINKSRHINYSALLKLLPCTKQEVKDFLGSDLDQRVFSAMNTLRKKNHNIQIVDGKYTLLSSNNVKSKVEVPALPEKTNEFSSAFNDKHISKVANLSPNDKESWLEAAKQSFYYSMIANAVLQSNKFVEEMREKLQ